VRRSFRQCAAENVMTTPAANQASFAQRRFAVAAPKRLACRRNQTRKGLTMCDFSLLHAKSRPAVVADKLVSHNFGRGTVGFKPVDDPIGDATAVCLLPGTELAFDKPLKLRWSSDEAKSIEAFTTAIFRQRDKDKPSVHHDVLEMPDGQQILLTHLEEGQTATVLQLPAAPRTEQEAEEQKRAEFAG
jgi:hypothetical protein